MADVGNPEKLGTVGVNDRLIPTWIIPGSFEPSRVDALMVHRPMTTIPKKGRLPPGTEITVIEVGYRNDHNRADKITEKEESNTRTPWTNCAACNTG
eukprot:jgi/Chrzof1/13194/Cz07g23180.t1